MRGHKTFDRWKFRENGEVRDVQVRGRLLTTSSEVVYQWTLAGEGIGIKALWDIHPDLASGRLIECLPQYARDDADMYIVYAERRHLPPRMRAFIDFLVAELKSFYGAAGIAD
ncbi:HTH-type transcriptional regulator DmlR [Pararobbsia alpina]|uniref:HTH-type transcriptional regulator DmlR n=2 Tax=Pararobbsia alpina TaxID=621374 RepID=A0A6S7D1V6_9BURK|nr:HTH-type transcriptional regulator DmlR [Pararobbsia alpina]